MTATVHVAVAEQPPVHPAHRQQQSTDWWVCWSPLVAGGYTAFKDRDEATEHSHRLWLRYGATVPVILTEGLPQ